jgi:formylglycine-generating enzyme required for sulfatase activity
VTGVTFFEAEAYCAWLGAQFNRLVRLPTEEEWEKAARGIDGRPWPWGDQFDPKWANLHQEDRVGSTQDAGTHQRAKSPSRDVSPYGLADMGGNVQEWTMSRYVPHLGEAFADAELRVARGGSWNDTPFGARCSFRHIYPPGYFFPFLGFRIVVERR